MCNPNQIPALRFVALAGVGTLALQLSGCGGAEQAAQPTQDELNTCVLEKDIYAQNRFKVNAAGGYGAAVRAEPDINSEKITSYAGNDVIEDILGFVRVNEAAYPGNPKGIKSKRWLVVKIIDDPEHDKGYISDAGIRSGTTQPDETGGYSDELGPLVNFSKLPDTCDLTNK